MMHEITPKLFENKFFTINGAGTNSNSVIINSIDMQYATQSTNISHSITQVAMSPTIFQKAFIFKPISILVKRNFQYAEDVRFLYNSIKNEIYKEFFKQIEILGEQNRTTNIKFDIDISEIKKNSKNIGRSILARLNNASNYIASQGRIGPAQWLVSNNKTYNYILSYLIDLNLNYNADGQLMIGNTPFIIDELIDDDIILIGRKNSIDQPGVHCIIRTDSSSNINFQEYSSYNSDKNYILETAIDSIGFQPHFQYFKIKTRSIGYYRMLKLQRLKELSEYD